MKYMDNHYLRELVRVLVKNLGILEKSEASCCGSTIAQCHAIVEIGRVNGISLNELSEILVLDKSTMSRTINNLVEAGLVVRDTHEEDRRYVTIQITDEGKKVYESIENTMEEYFSKILFGIPEEKRAQVIESLRLLVDSIKDNKCC